MTMRLPGLGGSHPSGWVINTYRIPNPGYLILHRASCRHVTERPCKGEWWTKDYSKACGESQSYGGGQYIRLGASQHLLPVLLMRKPGTWDESQIRVARPLRP